MTAAAVVSLALGIGANVAIFSVVNAVLLRPLPYRDSARIVQLNLTERHAGRFPFDTRNVKRLRERGRSFDEITVYDYGTNYNLTRWGAPERLQGVRVTANFFRLLGVEAALGRTFAEGEDRPGATARVVVLSDALWKRRFGGERSIVGRTVTLNAQPFTVIGVLPRSFRLESRRSAELWTPLDLGFEPSGRWLASLGKVRAGTSLAEAQAELNTLFSAMEREFPEENQHLGARLTPLQRLTVRDVRSVLLFLLGAVGFVLLIACANVGNLLLVRSVSRRREIAIRAALGAGRWQLARQFLGESLVLGALGGVAGLLLAMWGIDVLVYLKPDSLPRLDEIGIDARVLGFTAAIALLTGLVAGLAPLVHATRADLQSTLKEAGRGGGETARSRRTRALLAAVQVALAMVLLTGTGLMLRSLSAVLRVEPGFDARNVLAFGISLPSSQYKPGPKVTQFYSELQARLEALPGVEAAGATNFSLPLDTGTGSMNIAPGPGQREQLAHFRVVMPGYFRALKIPLPAGRDFNSADFNQPTDARVVVNEELARRFWPNENAIGRQFQVLNWTVEVVGVAGNVKDNGLDGPVWPAIYYVNRGGWTDMTLVVRSRTDPARLKSAVRETVARMDPTLPVYEMKTGADVLHTWAAPRRLPAVLLSIFGATALLLAAVGIYGVVAYSVGQRTGEFGIRMALGADRREIFRRVSAQALWLVVPGVIAGAAGAVLLSRFVRTLLFGVSATDPLTIAGVAAVLAAAAVLASLVPALRAARVDPVVALKYE